MLGGSCLGRGVRRRVTDILELPKESMINLPLITLLGREELFIENYKGIIEYGDEVVRISTGVGVVRIEGRCLTLKSILAESITITGTFLSVCYLD